MTLTRISPAEAAQRAAQGAVIVDIRDADEHARSRIPGARNVPLSELGQITDAPAVIWHCRSGMRTDAHAERLAASAPCDAYLIEGGIEGWRKAGLPLEEDRSQPLELQRQVQIAAGSLILIGVIGSLTVAPAFIGLAAFVGAGLTFAGISGWCGMARLLAAMPWNRKASA